MFIWTFGWGLYGLGAYKFFIEFVNMIIYIYTFKRYAKDEHKYQGETFKECFCTREFWDYCVFFLKSTYGQYLEYLGIEIITVLLGIYGNMDMVNAWVTSVSFMAISYLLGSGMGNGIRTFSSTKMGMGKPESARRFALWGFITNLIFIVIIYVFVGVFAYDIAAGFTTDPSYRDMLGFYILCYCIAAPVDSQLNGLVSILKLTRNLKYLMINSTINFVIISTTLVC